MAKKRNNPDLKFVKDKPTPKAQPNKSPKGTTNDVKKVLPTKDGIYKPAKKEPPKPTTSTSRNPKKSGPKKVQFSSRAKAEKSMRKNVKRRQRGKSARNKFNL